MLIHWLVGVIISLIIGLLTGLNIDRVYLLIGALMGGIADLINIPLRLDKFTHEHRNSFFHSIFFPLAVAIVILFTVNWKYSISFGLALMSHPFLDLYGIGWGVKLFYPFSNKTFKLFHNGRFLFIYKNDREVHDAASKFGQKDWFKKMYLRINKASIKEILYIVLAISIVYFVGGR